MSGKKPERGGGRAAPPQKTRLDTEVAKLASRAKSAAHAQGISTVAAFASLTKDHERTQPLTIWDQIGLPDFDRPAYVAARKRTLILELKASLLGLDACCPKPEVEPSGQWPTTGELLAQLVLIDELTTFLGKRKPSTPWECCQKIAVHFPNLWILVRINNFVTRIADCVPPRPLGVLIRSAGAQDKELTDAYLLRVETTRSEASDRFYRATGEPLPAAGDYKNFAPLLQGYLNAEKGWAEEQRQKNDRRVSKKAARKKQAASDTAPEITPYLAFLELERADLIWMLRFFDFLYPVQRWAEMLKDAEILGRLKPFYAATSTPVNSWVEQFKQLKAKRKAEQAAKRNKAARQRAAATKHAGKA